MRPGDTVARLSGDRFGIMLSDIARHADAAIPLSRLHAALAELIEADTTSIAVSVTIGVAVWSEDGEEPEPLLRNAEAAMTAGKVGGAGRTHFFSAALGEAVRGRAQMEGEMRRAITNGEFVVYFQPIVDGIASRTVGAEALIRWRRRPASSSNSGCMSCGLPAASAGAGRRKAASCGCRSTCRRGSCARTSSASRWRL
ncbi:MAG: diguanylate cyclase [Alphaproteobacteria bacterium]|nr:diguanylate cyclase [Alphaproteobacteria bacterium]